MVKFVFMTRWVKHLRNVNVLFAFSAVLCLSMVSPSKSDTEDDAYTALKSFSEISSKTVNRAGCLVTGSMDFDKFAEKIDLFREVWLNRDYSVDFYRLRRKEIFSYVIVKRFAELMTEAMYNGGDIPPSCSFSIVTKYSDKFGAAQELPAATWRFDKDTNRKMVWNNFDARDFAEVAIDYKISPEAESWFSDEPSMSDKNTTDNQPVCQTNMLVANATFIRAQTYCSKDYMDSPAGMYALAMSRQCAQSMSKEELTEAFTNTAKKLDKMAKQRGRVEVCKWVESVEKSLLLQIN